MADEGESDLRIVISTDNHLGYAEKDVVIGDDAFNNFEEVLKTAVEVDADFVLLGGDLFHESEPSKHTFVQTDRLLSKYCLHDKDVKFQILSDQQQDFAEGRVNFENPNLRVGLPVFSIHGNHDYPHGETSLSAVDVPSSSGLINYFGKKEIDEEGNLALSPILIQKGSTKVALYGLGHIADQRVGNVFRKPGAVKWIPPSALNDSDDDSWFNVFVLHQNRVQRGFSNTHAWIEDRHLAAYENLDFVLWGHEHQCITETQPSSAGHFDVLQPGSTVATSLAEGESDPKHLFILDIATNSDGDIKHRVTKQRLQDVRPFKFEHVVLVEQHGVRTSSEHSIKEFVRWKLESMVAECYRQNPEMLPLIRLRIDYTGFDLIRTHDIQKRFAGKVANPDDMLLWIKKTKRKQKQTVTGVKFTADVHEPCLMDELVMTELTGNLKMLSVESCTTAFQSVVLSNANSSIRTVFNRNADRIRERVMDEENAIDEETVRDHVKRIVNEVESEETRPERNEFSNGASLLGHGRARNENDTEDEATGDENASDLETEPVAAESTTAPVIKQEPVDRPRARRHVGFHKYYKEYEVPIHVKRNAEDEKAFAEDGRTVLRT